MPFSQIQPLAPASPTPVPAFSVLVQEGKPFEIPLSGTAWTYTGVVGGGNALRYDSKRTEPGRVLFGLTAMASGEFLLEFVRNDLLKDESEYLYVRVLVTPSEADQRSALLPSPSPSASPGPTASAGLSFMPPLPMGSALPAMDGWATPLPSAPLATQATPGPTARPIATASGSSLPDPEALWASGGAGALTKEAAALTDGGKAAAALVLLDWLDAKGAAGDEALWQRARALEAAGPARDIQAARAALARLMELYPESPRWEAARARIAYIDRHFLKIR